MRPRWRCSSAAIKLVDAWQMRQNSALTSSKCLITRHGGTCREAIVFERISHPCPVRKKAGRGRHRTLLQCASTLSTVLFCNVTFAVAGEGFPRTHRQADRNCQSPLCSIILSSSGMICHRQFPTHLQVFVPAWTIKIHGVGVRGHRCTTDSPTKQEAAGGPAVQPPP